MTIREDMIEQDMLEKNKCFVCHRICDENGDCEICNDPATYANTPIEIEHQVFETWQRTQNNNDRLSFHYTDNAESGIEYDDISIDYAWQGWLAAKQNTTPQSAWISVADRLPPENELVLVNYYFDDDKEKEYNFAIDFLEDGEWQDTPRIWEYSRITITHWQPLPKPPKTE